MHVESTTLYSLPLITCQITATTNRAVNKPSHSIITQHDSSSISSTVLNDAIFKYNWWLPVYSDSWTITVILTATNNRKADYLQRCISAMRNIEQPMSAFTINHCGVCPSWWHEYDVLRACHVLSIKSYFLIIGTVIDAGPYQYGIAFNSHINRILDLTQGISGAALSKGGTIFSIYIPHRSHIFRNGWYHIRRHTLMRLSIIILRSNMKVIFLFIGQTGYGSGRVSSSFDCVSRWQGDWIATHIDVIANYIGRIRQTPGKINRLIFWRCY